ncbi:MAG TPA: hypothetical protein VL098_07565 [Flavipsychrobacter sp.]|nr:hypothetical protein [Flavipsychrobacter sp.]
MKNQLFTFYFFTTLLIVSIYSCSKKDQNNDGISVYHLNGVTDKTLKQGAGRNLSFELNLKQIAGRQEKVTLSVEGLPNGLRDSFSSVAGTPGFNTTLSFIQSSLVSPGIYPLRIKSTTESGNSKVLPMNLTIQESCSGILVGRYFVDLYTNNILSQRDSVTVYLKDSTNNEMLDVILEKEKKIIGRLQLNCETQQINDLYLGGKGIFNLATRHIEYYRTTDTNWIAKFVYTAR